MPMPRAIVALVFAVFAFALPALAQDGYRIQPGDTLRVEVLEDDGLNRELLVLPDGRISMPLVGSVRAAGRTVAQVEASLTEGLSNSFARPPTVYVGVGSLADPLPDPDPVEYDVFVLGEANTPGRLVVDPGTTVLQVFAQMGGFTNFAATKRVQLRRKDPAGHERIYVLNYEAIQKGLSPAGLTTIRDGDVIVVPQRRLFE